MLNCLIKTTNPATISSYLKTFAIASALLILPLQTFAEKATHYGDINDEDGKYVAWSAGESDTVKTSHLTTSASTKKKSLKIKTKKMSESALTFEYITGYGDEDQF
ncbi:MAG: hypothetical protein AMJ53_07115 [Gammaproteobacteria bacterium SG8_11]|nr:MAG: hypothetical protein AMJ53_07115 [Gammaproteobacteria bacterium SG8_11]